MTITAIKDFKIKQAYTKLVEDKLFSYIEEGIYKPIFEILHIQPPTARNSADDIILGALRDGRIYYTEGGFKAKKKFSSAISAKLIEWGAKYDPRNQIFRISYNNIPVSIRVALVDAQRLSQEKLQALDFFLDEVQQNLPYIVESMVFNQEVETILDDAGKEVKKNVKHINVIEPELSQEQKEEIARTYTNNVRQYVIKDFDEKRIPEMRQKIQELVLKGARNDEIQKLIEKHYISDKKKARFLAQNETAIMLAEYKKVTYQEMGFKKFIWRTITDGRERELHKRLNGTTWSYDDPPVIDERTGNKGLPGESYNCRCLAVPYMDDTPFSHTFIDPDDKQEKGVLSTKASIARVNKYLDTLKASNSDDMDWITVKGTHIPLNGKSVKEAIKTFFEKIKGKSKNVIAGVNKGKPMTFAQANSGSVNPNYNKSNNDGYANNCQSCVAIFEARHRGYNVQTLPYDASNETMVKLSKEPYLAYVDKAGKHPEFIRTEGNSPAECYEWLKSSIKSGQRYAFGYKHIKGRTSHIIEAIGDKNGDIFFYDPQRNIKLPTNIVLNNAAYGGKKPRIFRVDDKELNMDILNGIAEKSTNKSR